MKYRNKEIGIPTIEQVTEYCQRMKFQFNPYDCYAHYKAQDFKTNKNLEFKTLESMCNVYNGSYKEEKQGKQKPADKVEPKFKVGNWYQCTKDFFGKGVTFDKDTAYYCAKEGCLQNEYGCHIAIVKDLYDNFKLWTIQDAKDGDVLATLDYILIFKEFLKNDGGISYCHYDFGAGNPQFVWLEDKNWYFGKEAIIHPATNEQRDLLFQKMKEAGYEWDSEKKELKKIEQKSDENKELTEFDKAVGVSIGTWNPKTPEQIQSVKAVSKKLLKLAKKQINDEQRPAWSEEDEDAIAEAIIALEDMYDPDEPESVMLVILLHLTRLLKGSNPSDLSPIGSRVMNNLRHLNTL